MTYNLLYEPWLPVRWRGGEPPTSLGLREALLRPHDIAELATDNPLETVALNRLLAAMVAAIFPELADEDKWFDCWEAKQFNANRVDTYLTRFADRFDLLSPTRAFYGHPDTEAKEVSSPARLQHAATSGNNALWFAHDLDSEARPLPMAEAARAVVCTQAAALGGGVAKPFNLCHAPLVGGAFFWLRGTYAGEVSLFRALLFNLAPTAKVWGDVQKDTGAETWADKNPPKPLLDRQVHGVRGLFTFQSRRLQLVPDASGQQVVGVRYNQGSKPERLFQDPHLAYRQGKEGEFAVSFSADRAFWQDSAFYMMHSGHLTHAPRTVEWLSKPEIRTALQMPTHETISADVFGMVNDKAKVELWRHERVTLYPSIINNDDRWRTLQSMLDNPDSPTDDARQVLLRLREATKAFATRARLNKPMGAKMGDVERADRDQYARMLDTESRYWVALGSVFDTYLTGVATLPTTNDSLPNLLRRWQDTLRRTARGALHGALESLAQDCQTWQALSEADTVLEAGTLHPKTKKTVRV